MSGGLPPEAYAAALAGLDRMTLHRLRALLGELPPELAYRVAAGDAAAPAGSLSSRILATAEVRTALARSAAARPVEAVWARCVELDVTVTYAGHPEHPHAAATDPLPAPVLFSRGHRHLLHGRRVALVGTRNATQAGRDMAFELGRGLAHAGVHVTSGLARGIDGWAHRGVTSAIDAGASGRPIAVVASGVDRVYPREHRQMWERIGAEGLLLTESPPGTDPAAYRFPLRNRLVAGLSEIVVVVESRERGGSLITATQAAERGVPVMAVPGAPRNRAALGVNGLLREGAAPVMDVGDLLVALSLDHTRAVPGLSDVRRPPRADDRAVQAACRAGPATLGELAARVGVDLVTAAMSVARLEQQGWLLEVDGWYQSAELPPR